VTDDTSGVKRLQRQLDDARAGNRARIAELAAAYQRANIPFQADLTIPALIFRLAAMTEELAGPAARLRVDLAVEDWLAEQWDAALAQVNENIAQADAARARAVLLQPGQPPPGGAPVR